MRKKNFYSRWGLTALLLLFFSIQGAVAQFKVVVYAASWSVVPAEIQYDKVTHINYSFIRPTGTGGLTALDQAWKLQDIVTRAHARGVKVGIAIGGWSDFNNWDFQSMSSNSSYRAAFVTNVINLLNQYNLDGVDIDWEFPKDGNDPQNFSLLMNDLANALRPRGKFVSAAVQPEPYWGVGILSSVFPAVDMLNLMIYDLGGSNHSSWQATIDAINYWTGRGCPSNKLTLGVPFYSRSAGTPYKTLLTQGASPNSDSFNGQTYNGIPTIKAKTNLAFDRNIGGMMVWEISQDATGANSLINAMNEVVKARSGNNNEPRGPYLGTVRAIPGKIEAEHYDTGGQGKAYNDVTGNNEGSAFRTDGVDIEATTDGGAGHNVGWTAAGEWLEYTVNVTKATTYKIDFRVASTSAGKSLRLEMAGQNVSGTVNVPNTGGWQTFQTVSVNNVSLTAGQKVMRIFFITDAININSVTFSEQVVVNQPPAVSLTSPGANASYNAPATIGLAATATDDGAVAKVEFFNGSTKLGEDLTNPYTLNWSNVAEGTYTLTARATDDKGLTTTSSPVTVSVTKPSDCPKMTWNDEFDGTALNLNKWNIQTGDGCPSLCGWGNNELEYYTNRPSNISVSGGSLALTARYEPNYNGTGRNYTSGKLVTAGKFSQKYGRFEARIKSPSAQGVWPAFWLLPDSGGWPSNGEIDILECANANPTLWYGTLHYATTSGAHQFKGVTWNSPVALSNDYHVYTAEWSADEIKWYVDGQFRGSLTRAGVQSTGGVWPFDRGNFYIILNVAVGGNFTGTTPNSAQYPVSMLVDYVRVYSGDPCNVTQSPYGGSARAIPGRIEAEHYDLGGQGVAYNDVTSANEGGTLRADAVDIEATTDGGAGHNLGWTAAGEWTEYSVNVTTAGAYKLEARVAATAAGKSFRVELDGQSIGTIAVPNTGGWQTWQTVTVTTPALTVGPKVMRIFNVTDGFNLNYLNFAPNISDPTNKAPQVSVTGPANGASFNAPANITIQASASDEDGTIAKVEFFNGATKLGEDLTSPYSIAWNNVGAGNYTITARATDNKGAATTSGGISVVVKTVDNGGCSGIAQYTENGGYKGGSKVQNQGGIYQCKPFPYEGWCNGASWAYAPGTGAYWADAWDKVGNCTAKLSADASSDMNAVEVYPNPTNQSAVVQLNAEGFEGAQMVVVNPLGVEVFKGSLDNNQRAAIDLAGMENGIYLIRITSNEKVWYEKLLKE